MNEPSHGGRMIGRRPLRHRPRPRLKPWHRAVLKFVIRPLLHVIVYLETFIHTRWKIVPVEELPEVERIWSHARMSRQQVLDAIDARDGFLCSECKTELAATRQEAEELFTDVWDIHKWGHCEQCAADREHHSRFHHGHLAFLQDGRWMVILPRVPLLRRLWLALRP